MGLTSWKNSPDRLIYKYDVGVAKNYLNEQEINKQNDLTNMFLVFAEYKDSIYSKMELVERKIIFLLSLKMEGNNYL